tara:strand:- start:213 stop:728 length:516 start_codon:yes stop_codon:yes gene_type:complete
MGDLYKIIRYFPLVDYTNHNLMNEYEIAYFDKISPFKDEYKYPIEYFDKLHYFRHKLHTEFNVELLYKLNIMLGIDGSNILKPELSNLINKLKKEQNKLKKEQNELKLIKLAEEHDRLELEKEFELMSVKSKIKSVETKINENELSKLFTKIHLKNKLNNKISKKNKHFNK